MDNSLKQRIIGAIVLAALAIIFLPAILKEKASNGEFVSQIPEKPRELKEYVIDKGKIEQLINKNSDIKNKLVAQVNTAKNNQLSNKQPEVLDDDTLEENQSPETFQQSDVKQLSLKGDQTKRKTKVLITDEQKDENKRQFVDSAWVVQVASFSNQQNAKNLVKKLKQGSFKAYRRKASNSGKTVYRVFVGPYIEKLTATKAIKEIDMISETKSVIRPFDPIDH